MSDSEIIQADEQDNTPAQVSSFIPGLTTKDLKKALKIQAEQRQVLKEFVAKHLVEGVDYGKIHIARDCQDKWNCKNDYHYSKDNLFKPGQEKIFSLFNIETRLEPDTAVLEMLQGRKDVIAWKCIMLRNGREIGEGHGVSSVGEGGTKNFGGKDPNAAVKIAAKRARMDACLSLGFSEFFGQDAKEEQVEYDETPSPDDKATDDQRAYIFKILKNNGLSTSSLILEALKLNGIDPDNMTVKSASGIIERLKAGDFSWPSVPATGDELPVIDINDDQGFKPHTKPNTDDIPLPSQEDQESILNELEGLGLNSYGRTRLIAEVSDHTSVSQMNGDHWTLLTNEIENFRTGEREIPKHWKAKKTKKQTSLKT